MNKCELCSKEFKRKYDLDKHLKRKIPCNNIIQCNNCLKIFKTTFNLNRHQDRKIKCEKVNLEQENKVLKEKLNKNKGLEQIEKKIKDLINSQEKENKILKQENKDLKETVMGFKKYLNIGFIYILTNMCYEIQDIYKVGQTGNLKNRLSNYNTPKVEKDKYQYVFSFETNNIIELEKYIHKHSKLKEFKTNNELYKIKFEDLKNILIEIKNEFENL